MMKRNSKKDEVEKKEQFLMKRVKDDEIREIYLLTVLFKNDFSESFIIYEYNHVDGILNHLTALTLQMSI